MPIPAQRDAEKTRSALAAWLASKLAAEGDVSLSEFRGPGATGCPRRAYRLHALP